MLMEAKISLLTAMAIKSKECEMENYDIDIYGNPIKVKKPSREFKGQSLIYFPKSYVVIDLETTGFDPKCNEILEIVALRYENNEKIAEFSKLIKVSFLPSFITEFTGINEDMIKNCNDISQTLKEFDDFLKSGDILVAHNAHFDINFLYDNFMCYLNKPFSFDFVDTMRLSKLINQELAHHRLKDLCNQYNICYENAHRGEKDCELTHLCLMELKKANNSVSIHHHKDTITIRYFPDIYASAGFGNANENENFQLINIDKAFLTDVLGVPYKTQYNMIKIYGESMEPFIQNGSFIIIDTTKNSLDKIRNADVVIFRKDDELFCKRILKNAFDDDIVISSDNFNFGDKKIKKSALKNYVFIGVVVCSCNAKIFLNQIERV